ncbi:OmpA family protein [Spirosoma flavum]|uniref:OmpA family protein n=1 Tax=Spirosoma flavum TaxID=2048557 RepID=A0ABW6AGS1_9BACT
MSNIRLAIGLFLATASIVSAQQKTAATTPPATTNIIPISKADLGTFPYFKTLPNFTPINQSDSLTIDENRTYFFDGKNYLAVDGQVSSQILSVKDDKKKIPSEFQIIQEFDKVVTTLGGKKIYAGKLPEEPLKKIAAYDLVELGSKHQVASSAYYGVVEYVIKTATKEVWVQLVPSSIGSKFISLLIVEKQSQLIGLNTNKENAILKELEKNGKAISHLDFELDSAGLLTQSKDELLHIVGIFQAHPEWRLRIEVNTASVGKPEYNLSLTEKRAVALKEELVGLGVKATSVEAKGVGDTKPLGTNDTEKGRLTNTRVEIVRL